MGGCRYNNDDEWTGLEIDSISLNYWLMFSNFVMEVGSASEELLVNQLFPGHPIPDVDLLKNHNR